MPKTFSSELRFRWSWIFRKSLSGGLSSQQRTSHKINMCKCCDMCFSHVSTRVSVSLSTWDLSNYSCCIPFNSMVYLYSRSKGYIYFHQLSLRYLHISFLSIIDIWGWQQSFSHSFKQIHLEHVNRTISKHMISLNGIKSLFLYNSIMIWSSSQYDFT
jgi:hypothetical protein